MRLNYCEAIWVNNGCKVCLISLLCIMQGCQLCKVITMYPISHHKTSKLDKQSGTVGHVCHNYIALLQNNGSKPVSVPSTSQTR